MFIKSMSLIFALAKSGRPGIPLMDRDDPTKKVRLLNHLCFINRHSSIIFLFLPVIFTDSVISFSSGSEFSISAPIYERHDKRAPSDGIPRDV